MLELEQRKHQRPVHYLINLLTILNSSSMVVSVNVKARYTVKPSKPTWSGSLPLTEWDQIRGVAHVPTIYFYKPTSNYKLDNNTIVDTLKDSLSHALVIFFPLAGRLRGIGHGRLGLRCNSMGVEFIEAESDTKLDDLGDLLASPEYESLIPNVDYSVPLNDLPIVLVQVTAFKCGGVSLSLTVCHAVADGQSALHFISEWARIARGEAVQTLPSLDRSVFLDDNYDDNSGDSNLFEEEKLNHPPFLIGQSNSIEERKKKTAISTLKLSRRQVEKLKNRANENITGLQRPYTRYETITAHMWRTACKARGHQPEQPTAMGVCVDARNRMRPPLTPGYFGNAVIDVMAITTSGDLMSNPLSYGCNVIRKTIEKVTSEYIKLTNKFFKNQKDLTKFQDLQVLGGTEGRFFGNPNLMVTSWLTLPLYGINFGWGKEIRMGLGTYGFDGDCLILSSSDGDGSVIVAMCLQEFHMEAFKKYFYEDIIM